MTEWNGTTVEDLISWLNASAGPRAGVSAANGVIAIFDAETGAPMAELVVDGHVRDDTVTLVFEGPRKAEAAEFLFVNIVDGGLDQSIEGHLNGRGLATSIGDADMDTRTQRFSTT